MFHSNSTIFLCWVLIIQCVFQAQCLKSHLRYHQAERIHNNLIEGGSRQHRHHDNFIHHRNSILGGKARHNSLLGNGATSTQEDLPQSSGPKITNTQEDNVQPFVIWVQIIIPATVCILAMVLIGYFIIQCYKKNTQQTISVKSLDSSRAQKNYKKQEAQLPERKRTFEKETDHISEGQAWQRGRRAK